MRSYERSLPGPAQNKRVVAINSAISVDLTGQVNADSIGSRIYSGVGGQVDFIRAARLSLDGRSIIAMPSTARGGETSRIVPELAAGAGVVTREQMWILSSPNTALQNSTARVSPSESKP
jgi:acyl-CoA hydrolase